MYRTTTCLCTYFNYVHYASGTLKTHKFVLRIFNPRIKKEIKPRHAHAIHVHSWKKRAVYRCEVYSGEYVWRFSSTSVLRDLYSPRPVRRESAKSPQNRQMRLYERSSDVNAAMFGRGDKTDERRAAIGKYAAENGNSATVKKFQGDFDGQLGESTVRLFKQKYYQELKKVEERTPRGEAVVVKSIPSKRRGPLTLGKIDQQVQTYVHKGT